MNTSALNDGYMLQPTEQSALESLMKSAKQQDTNENTPIGCWQAAESSANAKDEEKPKGAPAGAPKNSWVRSFGKARFPHPTPNDKLNEK